MVAGTHIKKALKKLQSSQSNDFLTFWDNPPDSPLWCTREHAAAVYSEFLGVLAGDPSFCIHPAAFSSMLL